MRLDVGYVVDRDQQLEKLGGRIDIDDKIAAPCVDKGAAAHQLAGLLDLLNFLADELPGLLHRSFAVDAVEGQGGHVKSHDDNLLDDG